MEMRRFSDPAGQPFRSVPATQHVGGTGSHAPGAFPKLLPGTLAAAGKFPHQPALLHAELIVNREIIIQQEKSEAKRS